MEDKETTTKQLIKYIKTVLLICLLTLLVVTAYFAEASHVAVVTDLLELQDTTGDLSFSVDEITPRKWEYDLIGTVQMDEPEYSYWNFVLGDGKAVYQKLELIVLLDSEKGVSIPIYLKDQNQWIAYLSKKVLAKYADGRTVLSYVVQTYDLQGNVCKREKGEICLP